MRSIEATEAPRRDAPEVKSDPAMRTGAVAAAGAASDAEAVPRWYHARVIWNGQAGEKRGPTRRSTNAAELLDLMGRHGLGDDLRTSSSEEEGRHLVRQAIADGCDLIVAAGGDGTIGVLAGELLGTPTVLGILPLGSIMNVPRMLGIPTDLEAAAKVIASGETHAVDVGVGRDQVFYEAGSVGMNAAIFREAKRFGLGDWASLARMVWVTFRYRPARMEIILDDEVVRTRALMISVSNGPYIGPGMTVAPEARLDDGRFDVRVFRHFSKLGLIRHLAAIAFGRRQYSPEVSTYRSARVRIESVHPLPCRVDSTELGVTPVEFLVRPAALRVVVPGPPIAPAARDA